MERFLIQRYTALSSQWRLNPRSHPNLVTSIHLHGFGLTLYCRYQTYQARDDNVFWLGSQHQATPGKVHQRLRWTVMRHAHPFLVHAATRYVMHEQSLRGFAGRVNRPEKSHEEVGRLSSQLCGAISLARVGLRKI